MCGIVGYLGKQNAVDVILQGLSRLEYRGYDSAGICIKDVNGQLVNYRKTGKLINLKEHLATINPVSPIGIGHTRWATHGGVTAENAHPHNDDEIALVHNGIIENATEIKEMLVSEGFTFKSETDTEVFLVLLQKFTRAGSALSEAIRKSFCMIRGNSAFVVMSRSQHEIYTIKRTAPIVCGKNSLTNEVFVSSDPYALIGYADALFFPDDDVLCNLFRTKRGPKVMFSDLDGLPSTRFTERKQSMTLDSADKGEFEHFMLKEIHEQPNLVRNSVDYYLNGEGRERLDSLKSLRPTVIHLSACGTAWHAGLVIRDYIEQCCGIVTNVELASEFRYRNPLLKKGDIGLFISQSGETADTLAAEELCRDRGLSTYSIVNVEGSTLYRHSTDHLLIHAGIEVGVASTKAFTLQALTGYFLAKAMSGFLDSDENEKTVFAEVNLLADRIEALLKDSSRIADIASSIHNQRGYLFTGRGPCYPIALEGALKLKEIAYVHAEGYAAGELKHGPIALIDEDMVNIAIISPDLYDKTRSNLEEVKARKGLIVGIGPEDDRVLESKCDHYIPIAFEGLDHLAPLLVNVVNQLLAYYVAKFKGTDIDKPRNLAKSVTVE